MINPIAHLLFILAAWLVFNLSGQRRPDQILAIGGLAFLAIYAPVALAWISLTALEASLLTLALRRRERNDGYRQYLPYVLLANLLFVDLHPRMLLVSVETLAISFSTIRIFMTAKQLLSARKDMAPGDVGWIWVAGLYLPALIVGPVFSGTELRAQAKHQARPDRSLHTYRFLLTGMVTLLLINPIIFKLALNLTGSPHRIDMGIEGAPLLFVLLFTGFYGQSLIAEYTSRLFGRTLPYNFDRPWLAENIRGFWSRWHRSMANFVMQYIFLPLNLRGVNARLATIAAFVFMGLWHNLSTGYLIWGFAHGTLLAFWPKDVSNRFAKVAERIFTWGAVMGLSYIANYSALA